jgi:transposase
MSRISRRARLRLEPPDLERLEKIATARKAPLREIERANIMLLYSQGLAITEIGKRAGVSRPTIYKCIDKALAMGIEAGLKDAYHRPKDPDIDESAKAWIINLACSKPTDHGYAAEMWTRQSLANHARRHGPAAGYPSLARAAKATIQRILTKHPLRPHKIAYYLERRDPEFDAKMREVLVVYQEVNLANDAPAESAAPKIITLSVDEKPGVQALAHTAPDLMPDPSKNSRRLRDYEYKRLGTLSVLAALDLHNGHVIAQVHERHRSREFVELLREIDNSYPTDYVIRLILDNHSAHISKETRAYLATRPGRFIYVHTPKHGSWLNLVETLFGKMARTFLKHIRVESKAELKRRILLGIEEINARPVVFRWRKFDLEPRY